MWGVEGINDAAKFMHENFGCFTEAQIEEIALLFIAVLKVSMIGSIQYAGAKMADLKPFFEVAVRAAADMAKSKENIFDLINISVEGVEACKVPGFNPFTITSSGPISLTSLTRPA